MFASSPPQHEASDAPNGRRGPSFRWPIRVYYEDTDAGGIVYYANYLRYFERARTEWLRALGASHREFAERDDLMFVVRDLSIDYRRPARLDDELDLELDVAERRRASMTLVQRARLRNEADTIVEARVRIAIVRRSDGRPVAMPAWLGIDENAPRGQRTRK